MPYTIGQLAREAGVNVETIRYYERRGLLQRPRKPARGYRLYGDEMLARLRFIRRAKRLGFALDEIGQLMELSRAQCADVENLAGRKLAEVRAQLADLRRLEGAIEALVRSCRGSSAAQDCPIIATLSGDD